MTPLAAPVDEAGFGQIDPGLRKFLWHGRVSNQPRERGSGPAVSCVGADGQEAPPAAPQDQRAWQLPRDSWSKAKIMPAYRERLRLPHRPRRDQHLGVPSLRARGARADTASRRPRRAR
jgi:hypothetical protein